MKLLKFAIESGLILLIPRRPASCLVHGARSCSREVIESMIDAARDFRARFTRIRAALLM